MCLPFMRRVPWHAWTLAGVCLLAFGLRVRGINWPLLHPDEPRIAAWLEQTAEGRPLRDQLYPQGFFRLAQPLLRFSEAYAWTARAAAAQRGLPNTTLAARVDPILSARWFNVWAGLLACLAAYGFARTVSNSRGVGLFAAAWLAVSPLAVEHSHYGETDTAMLLTLTLFLWLAARATARRTAGPLLWAALAGGFAAGTKFTLLALLPVTAALALLPGFPAGRRPGVCAAGRLLAVLAAFAAGFVLATPAAGDVSWFTAQWLAEKRRLAIETALNLGPLRDIAGGKPAVHARILLYCLLFTGWLAAATAGAGALTLARRPARRAWPALVLFPAVFLAYWIFGAPWVRTQEFLALLPVMAAWAGLALAALWTGGGRRRRALVLALAAGILGEQALRGSRVASVFAWPDTRFVARQWLERTLPAGTALAAEQYADACPDTGTPVRNIRKVEREGWDTLVEGGAEFLLRAASVSGRGLVNPLTGRRYPEAEAEFERFLSRSERLRAWTPLPPRGLTTFGSPAIELYTLRMPARGPAMALELPQPLWVPNFHDSQAGGLTLGAAACHVGPAQGVLIDARPRFLAIGGPDAPDGPVFLVCHTAERGATVTVRGFGSRRRAILNPYEAAIIPLQRPAWRPRAAAYEIVTLQTESRRNVLYLPCFAQVAFSLAEAARICRELGAGEAVWTLAGEDPAARLDDPGEAYLLAVRTGRWALAGRLEPEARRLAARLEVAARADPHTVRIRGVCGRSYDALARLRPQAPDCDVVGGWEPTESRHILQRMAMLDQLDLTKPLTDAAHPDPVYEAVLTLPVVVARGVYQIKGRLQVSRPGAGKDDRPATLECAPAETGPAADSPLAVPIHQWVPFTAELRAAGGRLARWHLRSREPLIVTISDTELTWSLAGALQAVREDLAVARAEHAVQQGRPAEALRLLAEGGPNGFLWNGVEASRVDLAARQLEDDAASLRQAAERRLAGAPCDFAALSVMGRADVLRGNLAEPVRFGSWMRVVGFSREPDGRRVRAVFEALQPDTPPLAATVWIRRRAEWRRKQVESLGMRRRFEPGERVAVEWALSNPLAALPAESLALGLEADVLWHAGALPAAGRREPVVPFSELAAQAE